MSTIPGNGMNTCISVISTRDTLRSIADSIVVFKDSRSIYCLSCWTSHLMSRRQLQLKRWRELVIFHSFPTPHSLSIPMDAPPIPQAPNSPSPSQILSLAFLL